MKEKFMKAALRQAQKAYDMGEVPIGAVIVQNGEILATGYNERETKKNSLCHAEILAINKACRKVDGWRLPNCELYVTLEPCPMCAGAIIQSRIDHVYFGAFDQKAGCAGSVIDLFQSGMFNYNVCVTGGILQEECVEILQRFFKELRKK